MINRIVAALLLAAGLSVAVPAAPTNAGDHGPLEVSVANSQFTPATLRVPSLGGTVTWRFPDAMAHTTTSTQGFWDSGSRSGGETFARDFTSAGSYPYRCTFHSSMTGTIAVPVSVTGSSAAGWTLRWTTGSASGETYDVQVRKGHRAWKALRTGTSSKSAGFKKPGTWSVRARTHDGSARSGWSPAVVFKTL